MKQPLQVLLTFACATMLSLGTLGVVIAAGMTMYDGLLSFGTVAYHHIIHS
jgi:hypothetical protein